MVDAKSSWITIQTIILCICHTNTILLNDPPCPLDAMDRNRHKGFFCWLSQSCKLGSLVKNFGTQYTVHYLLSNICYYHAELVYVKSGYYFIRNSTWSMLNEAHMCVILLLTTQGECEMVGSHRNKYGLFQRFCTYC